jgi:hypothetical protein
MLDSGDDHQVWPHQMLIYLMSGICLIASKSKYHPSIVSKSQTSLVISVGDVQGSGDD